jgi:sec-independent protein translocase protein TatA
MPNIGGAELILILVIALVIFGPKKLPEMGRSMGKGIREFRRAVTDIGKTVNQPTPSEPEPAEAEATETPAASAEDPSEGRAAVEAGKHSDVSPDPE